MARNQRLNATITIGAALQGSVRRNLDVVGRGLQNVGDEIRSVTQRQRELGRQRRVLEQQGQSVEALDREYRELTETLGRLEDRQRRLRAVQDGIGRVGGAFTGMTREITRTARTTAIAVGAVGAAMLGIATTTAQLGDDAATVSAQIGMNSSALQELQFAAEQSDVATSDFNQSMEMMVRNIGLAQQGLGRARPALEALGLSAAEMGQMLPEDALGVIADRLNQVETQSERVAIATQLFGSAGADMALMLSAGSEGLNAFREDARALGLVLSEDTLAAAGAFDNEIRRSQMALLGMRNTIGAALIPTITELAGEFTAFVVENRPLIAEFATTVGEGFRDAIPVMAEVASGLGDVARVIGDVVTAAADLLGGWDNLGIAVGVAFVSPAILAIGRLGFALAGLIAATGPIGLVIAGVAAAAGLIIANWDTIRDAGVAAWDALRDGAQAAVDWVVEKFQWLADRINALLAPIRDAFSFAGSVVDRVGNFFEPDEPSTGSSNRVQTRAVGGSFLPGATLVGERGPELRFESRAGFIATNRQLRGMADMADRIRGVAVRGVEGAAQQVQQALTIAEGAITINAAPGMDPRAIADAVLGELQRRQRGALYEGSAF